MSPKDIEKRLQMVEDILAIDKLEKVYGYYLDNGQNGKRCSFIGKQRQSGFRDPINQFETKAENAG